MFIKSIFRRIWFAIFSLWVLKYHRPGALKAFNKKYGFEIRKISTFSNELGHWIILANASPYTVSNSIQDDVRNVVLNMINYACNRGGAKFHFRQVETLGEDIPKCVRNYIIRNVTPDVLRVGDPPDFILEKSGFYFYAVA